MSRFRKRTNKRNKKYKKKSRTIKRKIKRGGTNVRTITNFGNLVPGQKYKITFRDINGEGWVEDEDNDENINKIYSGIYICESKLILSEVLERNIPAEEYAVFRETDDNDIIHIVSFDGGSGTATTKDGEPLYFATPMIDIYPTLIPEGSTAEILDDYDNYAVCTIEALVPIKENIGSKRSM